MKVATSKLTGLALRYAVAKCEGYNVGVISAEEQWERFIEDAPPEEMEKYAKEYAEIKAGFKDALCNIHKDGYKSIPDARAWKYDTDWAVVGPIIDRKGIYFSPLPDKGIRAFQYKDNEYVNLMDCWGYSENISRLVVAMRCYVYSKLGEEVEVPDELCE